MARFQLADRLHKTIGEIGEMSEAEFDGWLAYFEIMDEKRQGR